MPLVTLILLVRAVGAGPQNSGDRGSGIGDLVLFRSSTQGGVGAFYTIKAVIRPMLKAKSGRIVNMSSVSGQGGQMGQSNYSSSKAGLIGLTKTTAREVASRGITCNAVAPGMITTDLTTVLPEALKAQIVAATPFGHFGTAEDIANAVTFLVSDEAAYITGQVLAVDGGLVMM
jgi:3-oxoacyl-[acyl-carrier protein] reductase